MKILQIKKSTLIMENIAVTRLMRLINSLSIESKLEILSKLSENLKVSFNSNKSTKESLLEELFGSWSETGDDLLKDILDSRTSSDRNLSFD